MPRAKKQKRKDGRYQLKRVIGHDSDGKPITKWFYGSDKSDAINKYTLFILDKEKEEQEKKQTQFEKWATKWLYTYKEPDVKKNTFYSTYYRPVYLHLIPHFKSFTIQNITQADIKAYFNDNNEKSLSSLQKDLICLKGIFESAIDNDLIIKNPCRNIKIKSTKEKQKKRTYDKETVDKLCEVEHKYSLIINLLLKLGLRASEICGLKWENVDLKKNTVTICNSVVAEGGISYVGKPKTENSIRKLPLDERLVQLFNASEKTSDFVINKEGKFIVPNQLYVMVGVFYNYVKAPKENKLSPHELRHTCGTLLYESTKDIYHVSRYLGHSDIGITTKIYVHSEFQEEKVHLNI